MILKILKNSILPLILIFPEIRILFFKELDNFDTLFKSNLSDRIMQVLCKKTGYAIISLFLLLSSFLKNNSEEKFGNALADFLSLILPKNNHIILKDVVTEKTRLALLKIFLLLFSMCFIPLL